jgi:O-antigen/teichoic acid export membrane protein
MSVNKNMFYTFLAQIPIQLLGIVSGVLIARMIGPEGKGAIAIYQANAQLLTVFFSLSLGNVLSYFIPSNKIKVEKMLGISLLTILLSSICILVLTLMFYHSNFKNYLFPTKHCNLLYLIWIFFYSVLLIINVIATGFFQGLKLFNLINKILIINSILNFLFFMALFLMYKLNYFEISIEILLYCLLIITLINTFQFIIPFVTLVKIIPDFNISFKKEIKPILNFAFHTHSALFINFFNGRLSLWILNFYLNEVAIGLFSLATNLIVIFNMISAPIGNVLMPFLSDQDVDNKNEIFYKYSKINFTLLLGVCLLSFVIASPIISCIYGIEFIDSVLLFQILIPGILFSCIGRILAVYIAASNRQEYNLYPTIFGFVANIILSYYLIKYYGLIGAAVAGSLTYILSCLATMYYAHHKLKLPIGNYFLMDFIEIKHNFFKASGLFSQKKQ